MKLENLPSIPPERREAYADLAMSIFQQFPPADPHSLTEGKEQQHQHQHHKASKGQRDGPDDATAVRNQVRLCCRVACKCPGAEAVWPCPLAKHSCSLTWACCLCMFMAAGVRGIWQDAA